MDGQRDLLPPAADVPVFTLEDQIKCAEREVRMRERVYPRWVDQHKMTQANADREIATMKAIVRTLTSLKENPQ